MRAFVVLVLGGCAHREVTPPTPAQAIAPAQCTFLTINDTYRIEPLADGSGGLARVRTLRTQLEERYGDLVLLHAGDFLYPSLMSRTFEGRQMTEILGALDGEPAAFDERMYVVFGNHEFDKGSHSHAPTLDRTVRDSGFSWLRTNIEFIEGHHGGMLQGAENVRRDTIFPCGGLRVGIYGITTDRNHPQYVTRFDNPVQSALDAGLRLRADHADLVVALTHQSLDEDRAMIEALREEAPDLVVGGHEHDHQHLVVHGVPVYKADADARSAWRVTFRRGADGQLTREEELVPLGPDIPEDPAVKALVDARLVEHDRVFCAERGEPSGCLATEVGRTRVPLVAAELDIRRFETNFGSWITDRAREAFPDADIALVNSGALRLNRDLAAGPITRQDIEEMFAYPMPLVRLEIDGATLRKVVGRAVTEWTGNGHWLQVSGFAWVHDPVAGTGRRLTLLPSGRPVGDTDRLVVVVPDFLAAPATGQDGYTMLPAATGVPGPDLKALVLAALAASPDGIAPAVEGRICNPERPGPCLAN